MFSSGALDLALSKGLLDQPNHPRVKKFVAEVAARVHAAAEDGLGGYRSRWHYLAVPGRARAKILRAEKAGAKGGPTEWMLC